MGKEYMKEPKRAVTIILLIVMVLSVFITPTIIIIITNSRVEIFKSLGIDLPLPTRFAIGLGQLLNKFWYLWIFAAVLISGVGIYLEAVIKGEKRRLNFWFFLTTTLICWLMVLIYWGPTRFPMIEIRRAVSRHNTQGR